MAKAYTYQMDKEDNDGYRNQTDIGDRKSGCDSHGRCRRPEETEKKVKSLRQEMETRMNSELSEQKAEAEEQLARMEKNYELHHESYVKKLFQELIRE